MEEVVLNANPRTVVGKQVRALRREGQLPAILYGRRISPILVSLDLRETTRTLSQLSPSTLITINLGGETHIALVRDKQRDSLTGALQHVDFQVVSMQDTLRTSVALNFSGVAPAVDQFGAILMTEMDRVEIECLPLDIPRAITVDLSNLRTIGDAIYLKNIAFPEKVKVLDDLESVVAVVTAPEAEEEKPIEEAGLAEPEVVEKGKREEEEF
jgi:large subunit ribosomal protein L25